MKPSKRIHIGGTSAQKQKKQPIPPCVKVRVITQTMLTLLMVYTYRRAPVEK